MAKEKQENIGSEVAVRMDNLPGDVLSASWGAIEDMETTDLLVPKIWQMQAMSKLVADGKARPGDFVDNLTAEVLASKDSKLELIIFGKFKTVIVEKYDPFKNSFIYKETVTVLPENARELAEVSRGHEVVRDDGTYKYNLYQNYYCLLPSRMDELPYVFSLGSTKTKVALKLNTMIMKLTQQKKNGASVVFEVSSVQEKNDKGSWFGVEIGVGRATTAIELMKAHAWHVKSKSQKFSVEEPLDSDTSHM